ncbi:MAG: cupin domain-containing protein [Halovenus sp.]
MYSKINVADAPDRTRTDEEPAVRTLGYEIRERGDSRPEKMRFNYFFYNEGDAVRRHKQHEQEELFFVVSGHATMEVGGEEFEIETGDVIVVDPGPWRQIRAHEETEIFAVGAPNLPDDVLFEDELDDDE